MLFRSFARSATLPDIHGCGSVSSDTTEPGFWAPFSLQTHQSKIGRDLHDLEPINHTFSTV